MLKFKKLLSVITAAVLFISILAVLPMPESTAKAAQPFTVILNPGHGPASTGSGATAGGVKESVLNEQLTARVVSALKARGINVIVTNKMTSVANEAPYLLDERPGGTTDSGASNGQYHFKNQLLPVIQNPSLRLAGVQTPNLLITLHHNSTASSSVRGYELYYSSTLAPDYGKTSDTVARSRDFANMVDRQFSQPGFYLARRGVYDRENNSLTKYPSIPSVLVEAGYMSNSAELNAIRSSANQAILADRLANAVAEYASKYGNSYPAGTPQSVVVAEPIKISSFKVAKNPDEMSLTATAYGVTGSVSEILFAVWPEDRQDLLKWFSGTSSGNDYSVNVNMREFGSIIGRYTVHIYGKDINGAMKGLGSGKVSLGSKPQASSVKITRNADGVSLSATIKGVTGGTGGVQEVQLAIWPDGRSDQLRWITAVKSGNNYSARVNMRDIGNIIGEYTVHVYARDYAGAMTGIGSGKVSLGSKPQASSVKISGNADEVSLSAVVKGVSGGAGGVRDVLLAIWPDGRYDQLRWITAVKSGDNYSARVNMRDVGNVIGNYSVHVYACDYNGIMTGLGSGKVSLGSKPKASSVKVTNNAPPYGNSMTVTANGVKGGAGGITTVQFAVWPNGRQDLIKWYTGTKSGDNYSANVDISQFANRMGDYTIHVYATDYAGNQYGIGTAKGVLGSPVTPAKGGKTQIDVSSANPNEATVVVSDVTGGTGGIKQVLFAVWPTSDFGKLQWIPATKIGSQWVTEINIAQFGNTYGNYTVHTYAIDNNGDQYAIGSAKADLGGKVKTVTTNKSVYENADMVCYVRPGFKAQKADVAVWSRNGGQDDLQWVAAKYDASTDQWIANVNLSSFTSAGTFDIHAYAVNEAGVNKFINSTTVEVKAAAFNGYRIMGPSSATAQQLANYITSKGWVDSWYGMTALQFAQHYIDICNAEGVKAEVAFAQMCHETNNLKFGGDVTRDQFNFAGLGATGGGVKGITFANVVDGIKAQVQHLKRYASTEPFVLIISPGYDRYKYVTAGCAPTIEMLAGKWASDPGYAAKILNIIDQINRTSGAAPKMAAAPMQAAIMPAMLDDGFEIIENEEFNVNEAAEPAVNPDAELNEDVEEIPEEIEFTPLEPAEETEEPEADDKAAEETPQEPGDEIKPDDSGSENNNAVNTDITLVYLNPQSQTAEQTRFDVSELNPETESDAVYAAIAKLAKSDAFKTEVLKAEESEDENGLIKVYLSKPLELASALSEEQISENERAALGALADAYLYYIDGAKQVKFVLNDASYASAYLTLGDDETFKDLLPNIERG